MMPLKKPDTPHRAASSVTSTYGRGKKFPAFLMSCAPCIPGFLSGIIFRAFLPFDQQQDFKRVHTQA